MKNVLCGDLSINHGCLLFHHYIFNIHTVSVHGGWSGWSAWGGCPATCGGELESRMRTCTNPKPDRFGDNCYGDYHDYRICNRQPCPTNITSGTQAFYTTVLIKKYFKSIQITIILQIFVHGVWSGWSAWSGCPATCGGELESRMRTCTNGDTCYGDYHDYRICIRLPCSSSITSCIYVTIYVMVYTWLLF